MAKATLKIHGMSCQHCVGSVRSTLSALDGVQKADVSLEQAQAEVMYQPEQVTPQQLAKAIEDAGYDAVVV